MNRRAWCMLLACFVLQPRVGQAGNAFVTSYIEKTSISEWSSKYLNLARPERFELPTSWFVAMRSIQLSYGRVQRGTYIYVGPRADGGELP